MKKTLLTGLFIAGATMLLVNCGSGGGGGSSSTTTATTPLVQTNMGCLQQCGTNMFIINGTCQNGMTQNIQITGGTCTTGVGGTQICPQQGYIQTQYGMQQCVPGQQVQIGTQYPGQQYPGGGYYPNQYQTYPYYWGGNGGGYYYYYPRYYWY